MLNTATPKTFAAGALVPNFGIYAGFSLRETAGAAAVVRLWDNASAASGTPIAVVNLPASTSKDVFFAPGVRFANGLFAEVVSGAVEGSVYIG